MSHKHNWILVMFPEDGFVAAKCAHPDCEAYLSETEIEDILNLYPELLEALEKAKSAVEWMAEAVDSDPEDQELLELVNNTILKGKANAHTRTVD